MRPNWPTELGFDGWFVRFTGSDEAFEDMRNVLKSLTRVYTRWTFEYAWTDGKCGAWWIDEDVLLSLADSFTNLQEYMEKELSEQQDSIHYGEGDKYDP